MKKLKFYGLHLLLFTGLWVAIYFYIVPYLFNIRDVGYPYWVAFFILGYFPAIAIFITMLFTWKGGSWKNTIFSKLIMLILGFPVPINKTVFSYLIVLLLGYPISISTTYVFKYLRIIIAN